MQMRTKGSLLAAAVAGLFMAAGVRGAETQWVPGAVSGAWSDPLNWSAGVPQAGDAIGFGPSAVTGVTNDLGEGTWLSGITFDADAGAYTVGGNALAIGGTITNGSAAVQTVAVPLVLQSDLTVNNAVGSLVLNGTISGAYGLTKSGGGSLAIGGANTFTGPTFLREGMTTLTGRITTDSVNRILVGDADTTSIVTIEGGIINANRGWVVTDYGMEIAAAPGAIAAVRLNGGSITAAGEVWLGEGSTGSSYAAVTQTGGLVQAGRYIVVGHRGDSAVYNLRGGTLAVAGPQAGALTIGAGTLHSGGIAGNSFGVVNVTGGVVVTPWLYVGEYGKGVLNIASGGRVQTNFLVMGQGAGSTAGSAGILNLQTGGILSTVNVSNADPTKNFINFHGGTLRSSFSAAGYVYAEGLVVDSPAGGTLSLAGLLAPTGNGLASIAVSGGSGYLDTPVVRISPAPGDITGVGASASALIDNAGNLTGIAITNPGLNYTLPPIITVSGGGGTGAVVGAVSLTPNQAGGVTKIGAGVLSLGSNYTYSGPTDVLGGTLLVNGTFSAATQVNVHEGGTLLVNGTLATGTQVHIHGGGVLGGTGNVSSPVVLDAGLAADTQGSINLVNGGANTLTLTGPLTGGDAGGGASRLMFEIGTLQGTGDQLVLGSSALTLQGGGGLIALTTLGALMPGQTYKLMTFPAGVVPNVQLDANSTHFGPSPVTVNIDSTSVSVTIGGEPIPATAYWTGAHGSAWNAAGGPGNTEANFTLSPGGSNTLQLPGPGSHVYFAPLPSAPATIATTLGQAFIVDGLTVKSGTPPVAIGGSNTLMIGSLGIDVEAGAAGLVFTAPVVLRASQSWTNAGATPVLLTESVKNLSTLTSMSLNTSGDFILGNGPSGPGNGTLTISSGTTQFGTGGTLQWLTSFNRISVAPSGTLAFNLSNALSFSTLIANSGNLLKRGAGTLTLNIPSMTDFNGTIEIVEGTFVVTPYGLGGASVINDAQLSIEISGVFGFKNSITGTGNLLWRGAGSCTLSGATNYSGATSAVMATGRLIFSGNNTHAIGSFAGMGTLQVAAGAQLTTDGVSTSAWLVDGRHLVRANGGTKGTSKVASLTLGGSTGAWTGKLDLNDNAVIVQTGTASKGTVLATLADQIASGKAGGLWNGNGITSSTVGAAGGESTLALADNADLGLTSFRGQLVDGNSLIVVEARMGDATLDGKVDAFDLNLLAAHWQEQEGALWSRGDFTADGKVDAFDLNTLAAHWQAGVGMSGAAMAVPEPGMMGVLGIGWAGMLWRRRRNSLRGG